MAQHRLLAIKTAFSHFHEDGDRNGLIAGNRDNGGAANVDNNWRDNRNDNYAVRLVLARNKYTLISLCQKNPQE